MIGRAAIFLDRDGVLNENRIDHVKSWDEFRFLPGSLEALRSLSSIDAGIFIITNQGAIGQGVTTRQAVEDIHDRILAKARDAGARITDIRYCPHSATEDCHCRKPKPGLIFDVASEYDIDLSRSVFVGDAATDIIAGQRANCMTVLVLTGRGRQAMETISLANGPKPTVIVKSLSNAVPIINRLISRPMQYALVGAGQTAQQDGLLSS